MSMVGSKNLWLLDGGGGTVLECDALRFGRACERNIYIYRRPIHHTWRENEVSEISVRAVFDSAPMGNLSHGHIPTVTGVFYWMNARAKLAENRDNGGGKLDGRIRSIVIINTPRNMGSHDFSESERMKKKKNNSANAMLSDNCDTMLFL